MYSRLLNGKKRKVNFICIFIPDAIFERLLEGEKEKCCSLTNSILVQIGLLKVSNDIVTDL